MFTWAKKVEGKLFYPAGNDLFPLALTSWLMSTLLQHEREESIEKANP